MMANINLFQFCGNPCGKHGPYTFYKSLKYRKNNDERRLSIGDFFFVQIYPCKDIGIGELQLLWEDKNNGESYLSSVRLYFLPQDTREGRTSSQGQDEVIAESEKVVLKVENLIQWIVDEDVNWKFGLNAIASAIETKPSTEETKDVVELENGCTKANGLLPVSEKANDTLKSEQKQSDMAIEKKEDQQKSCTTNDNGDKDTCSTTNTIDSTDSLDYTKVNSNFSKTSTDNILNGDHSIKSDLENGTINDISKDADDKNGTINEMSKNSDDVNGAITDISKDAKDINGKDGEEEHKAFINELVNIKKESSVNNNDAEVKTNESLTEANTNDANDECKKELKNEDEVFNKNDDKCEQIGEECKKDIVEAPQPFCNVIIVSYPRYCRYRTILKRLEGFEDEWIKNTLVEAIGGFTVPKPNTRVLFCRNTCDMTLLEDHEYRLDNLVPNLKGRPRKKRVNKSRKDSWAFDSDNSNDSDFSRNVSSVTRMVKSDGIHKIKIVNIKDKNKMITEPQPSTRGRPRRSKNGQPLNEAELIEKLYKYMRQRNTPIDRIPSLGFKQINMYQFYKMSRNLGGYEQITMKRQWKHLYDKLGGNPANTSAATCTRRHYEKLLLPFELHEKGFDEKAIAIYMSKRRKFSSSSENKDEETTPCATPEKIVKEAESLTKSADDNSENKPSETFEEKDDVSSEALRDTVRRDIALRHQALLNQHTYLDPLQNPLTADLNVPVFNKKVEVPQFSLDNKHSVHHLLGNNKIPNRNSVPRSFQHLQIHNKSADTPATLNNESVLCSGNRQRMDKGAHSRPSVIQHTHPTASSATKEYSTNSNNHKRPYPFNSSLFVSPPYVPLPNPPPAHSNKTSLYGSPDSKIARLSSPQAAHQPKKSVQPSINAIDVDNIAVGLRNPGFYPPGFPQPSRVTNDVPLNLTTRKSSERERTSHHRKSSTPLPLDRSSYHHSSPHLPPSKKQTSPSLPYARDNGTSSRTNCRSRSPSVSRSSISTNSSIHPNSGHHTPISHEQATSRTIAPGQMSSTSLAPSSISPAVAASLTSSALSQSGLAGIPSIANLAAMGIPPGLFPPMVQPMFPSSMLGQFPPGLLPPHFTPHLLYGAGPSGTSSLAQATLARSLGVAGSTGGVVKGLSQADMFPAAPYLLPYQQLYAAENALRAKSK